MKLRYITFTGIDARTDVQELKAIQKQYPIAEFGMLWSYHWYENGNRYLNPRSMPKLFGKGINLALHVCGKAASEAADGYWDNVNYSLTDCSTNCLGLFQRIQLNISNRPDIPYRLASTPGGNVEVIIQQKDIHHIEMFKRSKWMKNTSVLLDASGGQGIDTSIEVLPNVLRTFKVGYAGGINPDNVAEKLTYLLKNEQVGDFWIDMESGVRTDDWFDLDKVRSVLELCQPIIEKYTDRPQ